MTTTTHPQVLTPRQAEALDLMVQFEAQHGSEPTPTQLAHLFHPPISASSAKNLIDRIEARLDPRKAPKAASPPSVDALDLLGELEDFLTDLVYLTPHDKGRRDGFVERIGAALEPKP